VDVSRRPDPLTRPARRASAVTFRRLARSDYALLARWLSEPHVARWWNHDPSAAAIEHDFGASIDGVDPADVFIVEHDAKPLGLVQRYLFADNPSYVEELAPLLPVAGAALSIDYFVGEPSALRSGYGSAMVAAAVAAIWRDHPAAPAVVVPVSAANEASRRTLERVGFRRVAAGLLEPDNPADTWDHVVYRIERPADASDQP